MVIPTALQQPSRPSPQMAMPIWMSSPRSRSSALSAADTSPECTTTASSLKVTLQATVIPQCYTHHASSSPTAALHAQVLVRRVDSRFKPVSQHVYQISLMSPHLIYPGTVGAVRHSNHPPSKTSNKDHLFTQRQFGQPFRPSYASPLLQVHRV